MGVVFGHFRGANGVKLRNYLEKLSYKLKLIVSKLIKPVVNLIRGFLRGSKRIKKDKISMKSKEINERRIYLKKSQSSLMN